MNAATETGLPGTTTLTLTLDRLQLTVIQFSLEEKRDHLLQRIGRYAHCHDGLNNKGLDRAYLADVEDALSMVRAALKDIGKTP